MPSLLIHLLIPPLVLLATRRFPPRLVLGLLVFSLLPDADFFVPPHRALFHSVFLPLALCGAWWRWRPATPARADAALVAAYYLVSHSLMDLFVGGVTPLFPLTDRTFFIDVQILINTRTLEPFPTFEPGSQQGVPELSPLYEFLDGVQFGILVLVLMVGGIWAVRRAMRVEREVVVVAEPESAGKG